MEFYIGIGFHYRVNSNQIEAAINSCLKELNIDPSFLKGLCTVDFKVNEELKKASSNLKIPIFSFSSEEINSLDYSLSKSAALEVLKIKGVAEPCAILAAKLAAKEKKLKFKLITRRVYKQNITLAVVKCYI
ncbi:MAG: cobalamin biosynthesis protein [Methanocellales archaeon]